MEKPLYDGESEQFARGDEVRVVVDSCTTPTRRQHEAQRLLSNNFVSQSDGYGGCSSSDGMHNSVADEPIVVSTYATPLNSVVVHRDEFPSNLTRCDGGRPSIDVAVVPYDSYFAVGTFWFMVGVILFFGLGIGGMFRGSLVLLVLPSIPTAIGAVLLMRARKHVVEFDRSRRIVRTSKEMLGCYRFDRRSYDFSELHGAAHGTLVPVTTGHPVLDVELKTTRKDESIYVERVGHTEGDSALRGRMRWENYLRHHVLP